MELNAKIAAAPSSDGKPKRRLPQPPPSHAQSRVVSNQSGGGPGARRRLPVPPVSRELSDEQDEMAGINEIKEQLKEFALQEFPWLIADGFGLDEVLTDVAVSSLAEPEPAQDCASDIYETPYALRLLRQRLAARSLELAESFILSNYCFVKPDELSVFISELGDQILDSRDLTEFHSVCRHIGDELGVPRWEVQDTLDKARLLLD